MNSSTRDLDVVYVDGFTIDSSHYRQQLSLATSFKCSICKRELDYLSEYAGTYQERNRVSHFCVACLPSATKVVFGETKSSDQT
jgi:hypothetical protein